MEATQTVSANTRNTEVCARSIALKGLTLRGLAQSSQPKTKLKLLSEINRLSAPSLSAEPLLGNALQHIREYYKANACLAVIKMPDDSYNLFKAAHDTTKSMLLGHELDESIAVHLLAIPPQYSIFYTHQAEWCIPSQTTDKPKELLFETMSNFGEASAHLLEVDSFASVPLQLNEQYIGRLYLTHCSQNFDVADMLFLQQLGNQIKPQINHIRLQNKIATTAASTATSAMRHKISIDLHDSTIQPYIGLKLGLEALRRKIPEGVAIAAEVDELVIMAEESIAELRQYIGGLKCQINPQFNPQLKPQLGTSLVASILEVAKKYQHRYGIEVLVNADTQLKLSEHLSTEIYQLVCEGLSNIHRHTQSKKAEINVYYQNNQLVIQVINQDDNAQDLIHFKPRSMSERVSYLGGTISVKHTASDKTTRGNMLSSKTISAKTIVTAEIPLQLTERRCASYA